MSDTDKPTTSHHRTFYWGWVTLVIGLVLGSISIFWVSPPSTTQTSNALPWEAKINAQGQLEVMGLTLNKSTPRDAMALYGKEIQTFLFTTQDNVPTGLESFFEDMYIGYTLRGKLVLNLAVSPEEIDQMVSRGARMKSLESGGREISLASDDSGRALDYPIHAITFIPYPKLDEAALESRFGKPTTDDVGSDGLRRWHYPNIQLIIIFDHSGRKALQFGQ